MVSRKRARELLSSFLIEFMKAQCWHRKLVKIRQRAEDLAVKQVKCVREANTYHRRLKSLRSRQDKRLRGIQEYLESEGAL